MIVEHNSTVHCGFTIDGVVARDIGIKAVLNVANEVWKEAVLGVINRLPQGWHGTGEDIRKAVYEAGVSDPHHPNAWGAMVRSAYSRNLIAPTGRWLPMLFKASHARRTMEWVKL